MAEGRHGSVCAMRVERTETSAISRSPAAAAWQMTRRYCRAAQRMEESENSSAISVYQAMLIDVVTATRAAILSWSRNTPERRS